MKREGQVTPVYQKIKSKHHNSDLNEHLAVEKPLFFEVDRQGETATVYDTSTNRLLRLDVLTADLLPFWKRPYHKEQVHKALMDKSTAKQIDLRINLLEQVEKEHNWLVRRRPTKLVQKFDADHVREELSHHLDMVVLQVTTACNFRCSYCIYNGDHRRYRALDSKHMSLDTAKAALKFFETHSSKASEIFVCFYGGEPLMNLPVVRWIIESVPSVAVDRPYSFHMTTNGSLLNDERTIRLLAKADVFLLVSLDGPQAYHDARRRTIGGGGTFDRIIDNLTLMERIEPDYFHRRVHISSVIDTADDVPSVRSFFLEHPLLSQQGVECSPVTKSESDCASAEPSGISVFKQLQQDFMDHIMHGERTFDSITRSVFLSPLRALHARHEYTGIRNEEAFFKCAVGYRLMIDPNGQFHPCSNVSDGVIIGDIEKGFDFKEIDRVMHAYEDMRSRLCTDCWAFRLCKLCYLHAFVGDNIDMDYQQRACLREKARLTTLLRMYCNVLSHDSHALDFS